MANETILTLIGNVTADPEDRTLQNGTQVVNFTVASTPRTFDKSTNEWKDGEALFMRCAAWRQLAEHVTATVTKGMRVIVVGNLEQKSYQDKEGNTRTSMQMTVTDIGPSLQFATAQVNRAASQSGGQQGQSAVQPQAQGYGPPQQNYGAPQTQGYPAPQQAQTPQQGYPAPAQQVPPQQAAQPQQAYPAPQQAQPQQNWADGNGFNAEAPF